MRAIRVIDVNDYTLCLFKASSKDEFLSRLDEVFRGDMREHFSAELGQMWGGDLSHQTEGLNNRAFFDDAVNRLATTGFDVNSIVIADLNGLKKANDELGHGVGDVLIRRAGEVLGKAVGPNDVAARIGGDEFALLMRGADEHGATQMIARIRKLIEVNNQFYQGPTLSIAMGAGTTRDLKAFGLAYKSADDAMYADKGSRRRSASLGSE